MEHKQIFERAVRVLYERERETHGVRDSIAIVADRLKLRKDQVCQILGFRLLRDIGIHEE
jgi:hypothetical protein